MSLFEFLYRVSSNFCVSISIVEHDVDNQFSVLILRMWSTLLLRPQSILCI